MQFEKNKIDYIKKVFYSCKTQEQLNFTLNWVDSILGKLGAEECLKNIGTFERIYFQMSSYLTRGKINGKI